MATTYLIGLGDVYESVDGLPGLWAEQQPEGTGVPGAVVEDLGTVPTYTRSGVAYETTRARFVFWVVGFNAADLLKVALVAALTPAGVGDLADGRATLTFVQASRVVREPQRGRAAEYVFRVEVDVEGKVE